MGCHQENPECGKSYRTYGNSLTDKTQRTKKKKRKKKKRNQLIKGMETHINQMYCFNSAVPV
jgi:hypothetical protein